MIVSIYAIAIHLMMRRHGFSSNFLLVMKQTMTDTMSLSNTMDAIISKNNRILVSITVLFFLSMDKSY